MEENKKPPDRSQRKLVYTALAAAAIVIAVLVVVYLVRSTASPPPGTKPLTGKVTLVSTGLVPGVGGDATLAQTGPGWRIELEVTGLARRDDQQYYYEAWLKNAAGILVPAGTFNQGPSVTLWVGVSPIDFPTLTVTEQQVGRSQASSGKRVLTGSVDVHH